jgi:pimeloyl-ACP methyl ester carboxylesterase
MGQETLEARVDGGMLVGTVAGSGSPVLLLHGGPGLGYRYLDDLATELVDGYRVAWFQQRGLDPSTARGPYDVGVQAADVVAVLDALGWDRAVVVGHSWGGHLLLHVVAAYPDRLIAAVVVDPLGGVGDGGEAAFAAELTARTPAADVARMEELDARAMAGEGTVEEALESLRLVWPAYYADPASAPSMPPIDMSVEAYAETWASVQEALPGLAGRLVGTMVPTVFVHGGASPMPVTASTDTAEAMGPSATVVVVPGTGHFIWHESPGAVRRALDEVLARG